MAGVGNFLGGLAQGAETGMKIYGAYKGIQRADAGEVRAGDAARRDQESHDATMAANAAKNSRQADFAKKMGALLDRWGEPQEAAQPGAVAEAQPMPQQQIPMLVPTQQPQPQVAPPAAPQQVGYGQPQPGAGLAPQPLVPMATRPAAPAMKPVYGQGLGR